jgi:hypothetical protein
MSKWARIDTQGNSKIVGEIIDYDPKTIINEQLHHRFIPCDENITLGYYYNEETNSFYVPDGYGKIEANSPIFSIIPEGFIVDENYVFIPDPDYNPPKVINEFDFRNKLILTEKILWDNPETGTLQQKALINTMKLDFPFTGIETIRDELDLLESLEVIGVGRADEIYNSL